MAHFSSSWFSLRAYARIAASTAITWRIRLCSLTYSLSNSQASARVGISSALPQHPRLLGQAVRLQLVVTDEIEDPAAVAPRHPRARQVRAAELRRVGVHLQQQPRAVGQARR